jgi:tuberous sclerosis protein 2
MDMLACYTFGMCSTVPIKAPMVEHLLDRSKSETWLLGHKLITITTSGCGSRATANGLCDKCAKLCKSTESPPNEEIIIDKTDDNGVLPQSSDQFSSDSDKFLRRRHQSEMHRIPRPQPSVPQAYDDFYLNNIQQTNSFPNTTTLCSCWCQGWAEIMIRRPTGNTSWIVRLQNSLGTFPYSNSPPDELPDLTALLNPQKTSQSEDPQNNEFKSNSDQKELDISESVSTSNSDFKRTTSSPDMEEVGVSNVFDDESESFPNIRPTDLGTPPRTQPLQPVTRAASFGSRISPSKFRSDMKTRLSDRKDFRSNDLESSPASFPQKSMLYKESSLDSYKLKSPVLPLRINEADHQMYGHRDRVHTISVMSPVNRKSFSKDVDSSYSFQKTSGLCPKFVFLQLYYNSVIDERLGDIRNSKESVVNEKIKPILLPKTEANDRSLKNFDRITPYETHKIGVVYVGPEQAKDKTAILSNHSGSLRYTNFLKGLGTFIRLEDTESPINYVGGLDTGGQDGKYALSWEDNLNQVIFHVATLMPTQPNDPNCNLKKRHIGNDFVCIVYNDSGTHFNIQTIKVCIY